jgi:NAD(P)-dependent dehydrogenase (short-subunit alcohol dehydrogenase family)
MMVAITSRSQRMGYLDEKVAIVTGATRGIGKGCALELGAAGATVYVTGRTRYEGDDPLPGSVEVTAREINELGGKGVGVVCDHADDAQVEALFERVRRETGRLDVLVNNAFRVSAGLDPGVPFWETPLDLWDDLIDVGTRSAYVAIHCAAPIMVAQQSGLMVNISSAGAIRFFHHLVYGVGKAALDRITKDAARPLAPHGVAIVSLWPNLVKTERVLRLTGFDLKSAESTRFSGRAVVALAADPDVMRYSGRAVTSRGMADAYGFKDVDGSLPDDSPWQPS